MCKYKYLNKDEKPVPRFHVGQHVFFLEKKRFFKWIPQETEILIVDNVKWVTYDDTFFFNEIELKWKDELQDHWEISYRHKPCLFNQRMVQRPLLEEDIYLSREEAKKAAFLKFNDETIRKRDNFNQAFRLLGIEMDVRKMLEEKSRVEANSPTFPSLP